MIKGFNAFLFILIPIIYILRNRFYFNDYIPRIFLVVIKLWRLLSNFFIITAILTFVYQVVISLNYNSPNNSTDVPLSIEDYRVKYVDIISYSEIFYLYFMLLLITLIVMIMFWFGGVAVAREE